MLFVALVCMAGVAAPAYAADSGGTQQMHRLYNPNSGEHFYTASTAEKNAVVKAGWKYEGIGWTAPVKSNAPVYRLYNPNAGDHHYTQSAPERDMLKRVGWRYEGIGWYSSETKAVPLYRQYNPNAKTGTHNYTTNKAENDMLVRIGWRAEGIGWYGVNPNAKPASPKTYTVTFKDGVDGKTLKTEKVESGKAATAPAPPAHTGYTFAKWDKAFTKITANTTVTATYTQNTYTVTFKDGLDNKTIKTQKVKHGAAATAPTAPTHKGYAFNKWDKAYSKVTGNLTVTATYTERYLEDYSWQELSAISKEISAARTEAAGIEIAKTYHIIGANGKLDNQTKKVSVNGVEAHVQIIGINHDDKASGGKAGLTFQFVECVTGHVMNNNWTNQGGWKSSEMRSWLASDLMGQLPSDLSKVIISVNKRTNNVGVTETVSSVTTTQDKLWLPSMRELCGQIGWWRGQKGSITYNYYDDIYNAEGTQYMRFRDAGVGDGISVEGSESYPELVKTALVGWGYSNKTGESCVWWLRSPHPDHSGSFSFVHADGHPRGGLNAHGASGVAPGFCV